MRPPQLLPPPLSCLAVPLPQAYTLDEGERLLRAAQGAQLVMLKDRPRNHFSAAAGPRAWEEQPDLPQRESVASSGFPACCGEGEAIGV